MPVTGSKFRANLRRRMRNLEKIGPVELKRYADFDSAVFEQFLELEHSGWKGRNGTSILSDPQSVAYFRAFALAAPETATSRCTRSNATASRSRCTSA